MSDLPKRTREKTIADHLFHYVMGVLVTTIGCGIVFVEAIGPPWSWPRGTVLGWLIVSGLFGLILGLAVDNLPPPEA